MTSLLGFPNPVNEKAARTVAAGVLVLSVTTLVLGLTVSVGWLWIVAVLATGFVARVLTGPKLSILGQIATKVVAPRLGAPKLIAGPPKRFAQAIGATVTIAATIVLATGHPGGTEVLLGLMIVAAGLESLAGYCIGCKIFAGLMRIGMIPQSVCVECANVALRVG